MVKQAGKNGHHSSHPSGANGSVQDRANESWSPEDLGRYVARVLSKSAFLQNEAIKMQRRSAIQLYLAGEALAMAKAMLTEERAWCAWLTTYNIARTSAWEAIQLFERAGSEEALVGLTLTEAKLQFGITKERTSASPASSDVETVSDRSAQQPGQADRNGNDRREQHGVANGSTGGDPHKPDQVPPKEDTASVLRSLVMIRHRLEYCAEEMERTDWSQEDLRTYSLVIAAAMQVLQRLRSRFDSIDSDGGGI